MVFLMNFGLTNGELFEATQILDMRVRILENEVRELTRLLALHNIVPQTCLVTPPEFEHRRSCRCSMCVTKRGD